ncbi:hypothetical protein SERLA73DRAFT_181509 [Serpula lacrymans var. lacrymans S7.3]|uniref:Uncharacterized protein n=2 Tax=Serpula lacrymans var. lacrymans TaxID=341189 RepID=F8PY74_SERL3|nr:uncharacterized protein SERLADRAFT_467692 [Serpula lacrymans var. lacrymans S7.9]EGN98837.1 hypothetical protein SERLA73DRAFT_181509 [Serpula lacrymans var. lacrymans S7.3]EGO24426.1 hypothetical protein SERLADRAFT_467692 [Serpula lacrymans var. lacrymans S7.9]
MIIELSPCTICRSRRAHKHAIVSFGSLDIFSTTRFQDILILCWYSDNTITQGRNVQGITWSEKSGICNFNLFLQTIKRFTAER